MKFIKKNYETYKSTFYPVSQFVLSISPYEGNIMLKLESRHGSENMDLAIIKYKTLEKKYEDREDHMSILPTDDFLAKVVQFAAERAGFDLMDFLNPNDPRFIYDLEDASLRILAEVYREFDTKK